MSKLFSIFTIINSFTSFYFLLAAFRQLTYGASGQIVESLMTGALFLSFALAGYMLKQIAQQSLAAAFVSVLPCIITFFVLLTGY